MTASGWPRVTCMPRSTATESSTPPTSGRTAVTSRASSSPAASKTRSIVPRVIWKSPVAVKSNERPVGGHGAEKRRPRLADDGDGGEQREAAPSAAWRAMTGRDLSRLFIDLVERQRVVVGLLDS